MLHKGSQLKLLLTLDGNQLAVLKPGRFERDYIIPGNGKGFNSVKFCFLTSLRVKFEREHFSEVSPKSCDQAKN